MLLESAVLCLALNVYHEARGEDTIGQYAVAQVTLNRSRDSQRTICQEVFRPAQFSWTNGLEVRATRKGWVVADVAKPREREAWEKAKTVAEIAMFTNMDDYSNGATHYHATSMTPYWTRGMQLTTVIGRHRFYRGG